MSIKHGAWGELRNFNIKFVAFWMLLLLALIIYQTNTMPQIIKREKSDATIIDIIKSNAKKPSKSLTLLKLELPNHKHCTVVTQPQSRLTIGSTIPVTIEIYDDKSKKCVINSQF